MSAHSNGIIHIINHNNSAEQTFYNTVVLTVILYKFTSQSDKAFLLAYFTNIIKLKSENDKLTSSLNNMNVEYNSKSSKKKILEGMENDYAGYSKSVKAVLKAEELKKIRIYGTVSGLVDVKKEYVTAIEIALGKNVARPALFLRR